MSGLRHLLVLLLGHEGQGETLEQARKVVRYLLCTIARQSEVHTSQKLRRALQLYSAYSRLWGEEAARSMLASLRRTLASKSRRLLLSAVCFSNFNWDQEKIPSESLQESAKDLESVGDLCRATVECHTCGKRQIIDQKMADVDYCVCSGSLGYVNESREYESWRPFIEREHHIVWRQRHPVYNHLFAYKVYGTYDDVSLSSFMEVQLNSSYRTDWDDTALELQVLDSHEDSNSDLLYWLVKFPHFFANRDYVFKRRFRVDREKKEVVIVSEAVSADFLPPEKGVHRVNEYWSTMVIRAKSDMDQPGIEYTLTYFDNPGTSLPQAITNFIAVTGFPNFLKKLHTAALHLQSIHEKGEDVYVSLPDVLRYPKRSKGAPEELPEPSLPSDEKVLPSSTEVVAVVDKCVKILSEESLHDKSQDIKPGTVTLAITSAAVEGSGINESECSKTEETHMQEELSITSTDLETHNEKGSSVSNNKSTSSPSDTSEETMSDMSLHVNVGGKEVFVDLLEAMEVVAPDLEKKTLLLRKIEELNEKMQSDNGKQGIILQQLWKLRHKLKSFHEQANLRREHSRQHMEELATRDRYQHMNIDEKTLTQLEMLFEAMRYVLQADKDMRTGKMLLEGASETHSKEENGDSTTENSNPTNLSNIFSILTHMRKDGKDRGSNEDNKPPDAADSETSKKSRRKRVSQEPQIRKDPPPPDSAGETWPDGEPNEGADDTNNESGNFTNELGNVVNAVNNVHGETGDSGSKQERDTVNNVITGKAEENKASSSDAQNNALLAHVIYIVSLGWVSVSERDEAKAKSEESVRSVQSSREDRDGAEESECHDQARWYWYPLSGAYRLYAWVFSASGVNA